MKDPVKFKNTQKLFKNKIKIQKVTVRFSGIDKKNAF